jgi:hypothetical protein
METNSVTEHPDPTDTCSLVTLSILELHVLLRLWRGESREAIAGAVHRTPRQISRIAQRISEKLGTFDAQLVRYRLEDELFRRIPLMSDRDLIAALKLYRPVPRGRAFQDPAAGSNKAIQSLLRKELRLDDPASETPG